MAFMTAFTPLQVIYSIMQHAASMHAETPLAAAVAFVLHKVDRHMATMKPKLLHLKQSSIAQTASICMGTSSQLTALRPALTSWSLA